MAFELNIETDNDAVQEPEQVARLLTSVATKVRDGAFAGRIMDENGNRVGEWSYQ